MTPENECHHILGDGSTLIVMDDGSLQCKICKEIILELELVSMICEEDENDSG